MDKDDYAKELMNKVKAAEASLIRLETQNESLMKSLKDEFKISTVEEAEVLMDTLNDEIVKLEDKENELLAKIKTVLEKDVD